MHHQPPPGLRLTVSHKLPWAPGRRARPVLAQYSENRAFRHETAAAAGYNLSLFQWVTKQIRYLADQWKINRIFSPINEFFRPNNRITMEFVEVVKTGKCGHLSALDALPANAHHDGGNQSTPDPVRGTQNRITGLKPPWPDP
jgi:hypothetical protein